MARIFDVIEYPNEMRDELVRRFPEQGAGDFRIGSAVIVREGQAAVFFRDGKALDTFGPGRHQITTANRGSATAATISTYSTMSAPCSSRCRAFSMFHIRRIGSPRESAAKLVRYNRADSSRERQQSQERRHSVVFREYIQHYPENIDQRQPHRRQQQRPLHRRLA
jgi:hypothetical protein